MQKKTMRAAATTIFALMFLSLTFGATGRVWAQAVKTAYPAMAPLNEYLMADEGAEIALARSAAPKSISDNAEVMVLGRHGYKVAAKGGNGFVCVVFRSWTAGIDDPVFWNPKLRAPICFNPAGARTYLPLMRMRTELILAGKSKAEAFKAVEAALDEKKLPALEPGAMCYMMSKQQYLGDAPKSWYPHLMFFVPRTPAEDWGANLAGSPVISSDDAEDRLKIFLVPVGSWSDGTAAPRFQN